ncbi:MAG: hypothetical protein K2N51_17340 [Lachnospiraceae bacterium]|nr:hypothetical protein [Lachnospiraceae bacterium]
METVLKICKKCGRYGGACSPDAKIHNGCGGELIDTGISHDELMIIRKISSDNDFLDAMIELKKTDIIEYNLKMSQFKTQANQQKQQKGNIPKCPTCGSTNLKKISGLSKAGSVAMWGVFAAGRTSKTWHCNNCGYEW